MKKNIFSRIVVAILFSLSMTQVVFAAGEPSSDIPARREFPLSSKFKPCDDFHKYVCDEVESSFKLRDDRSRHAFSFNDSSERILEAKKIFFANINSEKKLSKRAGQVKEYYQACMNESAGAKLERTHINEVVQQAKDIKSIQQFSQLQLRSITEGKESLLWFGTNSNQNNPEINDVLVGGQIMTLPEHTYYENKELMADYRKLIIEFIQLIEPKLAAEQLEMRADRLIAFEKEFVAIYPHPEVRRQRWAEPRQQTQKEFLEKYPNIPLAELITKAPSTAFVFNYIPESLEFFNQKYTGENLEVFKDFYLYAELSGQIDDSNPEYYNKQFAFRNKYLGGPVTRSQRDERCTREVMGAFPKEIDQILVVRLFPNFPEEKFMTVAKKMRETIVVGLQKNTWLEPATKEKAILKMEKAKLYLIKPRNDKEWDFLPVQKYSNINKMQNKILFARSNFQKQIKELKEGANLVAWGMGPLTVNAYYDPSANKFVMPMGILQYPFFNADGDLIENLGAVGAVIGHELGHGVDDQGARYDEAGRLKQWMSMKDLKEFSNRGQKLVQQFNKAGHNGKLTLGENIGDLVGLTFAYNAAFPDGKATREQQQKLFVAYARNWCNVMRPKAIEQQLKTDPHALGWARINEQVKHQKAFAEAYQCKRGDKMTLPDSERVQIW